MESFQTESSAVLMIKYFQYLYEIFKLADMQN
jgi:hypothetical protein